jgi:hypothetical protein
MPPSAVKVGPGIKNKSLLWRKTNEKNENKKPLSK